MALRRKSLVYTLLFGNLLSPISSLLGWIMNAIYEFFYLFNIQNIALSIFVFTFITKTLMLPLTIKQQKFTKLSSVMNPELQKIQAKYKGKKDEASLRKQQEETQAVYQKYGASPAAGCLPMLITLPIMFALYAVINNIPAYVNQVKDMYLPVADAISKSADFQTALSNMAQEFKIAVGDLTQIDQVIKVLARFSTDKWDALANTLPDIKNTIFVAADNIKHVNNFFGLSIINPPGWKFPGILIPIISMGLQFVQTKQISIKNTNKDNPTASAMSSMNILMPIMSGVFCITLPTGVGLYWIATSIYTIIQQFLVNKRMDKIDVEELIEKSVAKANKKQKRIAKVTGVTLEEMAKKQTKSIDTRTINNGSKEISEDNHAEDSNTAEEKKESYTPGSISEIANLLKNRNSEKGDK